ncbi:MAG TPA: ScpA family protein [Gammaproteobacteria bacterium]|nr:ScpA family protein [Gammaproteobacteria bacterium]
MSETDLQTAIAAPESVPFAVVRGEAVTVLPHDLYIPPDALEVFLEAFEGPLDLLLYLIKKQNLDILDIPIAEITRQYQQYIEMMQVLKLELAAEYLLMGAVLAEIKSRLLLPRPESLNEEEDPRAELVRRLKEYELYKQAAEGLDALPRLERDILLASVPEPDTNVARPLPQLELRELLLTLAEVLQRAKWRMPHLISKEVLSVRERMTQILQKLTDTDFTPFQQLLDYAEGRLGVVVTLSAILELLKQSTIEIIQAQAFAPIHVKMLNSAL